MNSTPSIKTSLRIDRLQLANYRCFAELTVEFHPRLTVLVANNGQGKTAVLDAVATAFGPFVGAFDDGKDRAFDRDDIRLLSDSSSAGNTMELADGGVSLKADGVVEWQNASWKRQLAGAKSRTTRKDAQVLSSFGEKLQSQVRQETESLKTGTCLPLVAYYPTDRLWNIRRLPYKKLSRTSRMVGYTHCLESGSDFHLMADWFRYWSFSALSQRLKAQQDGGVILPSEFDNAIEAVRKAVDHCLEPSGWRDMDFSVERDEIVAHHPQRGALPVAMLSDGIRSVLTLVADIAFRTVKLNPNLGPFAAAETCGVVLIDEVDMHLHPAWQQTVLASLCDAFPRIQFIVTTHSPQVLTSVDSACIRSIQSEVNLKTGRTETTVRSSFAQTKGVTSADVLAEIMGVNPVPDIAEARMVSGYHALIQQNLHDTNEGVALRAKLVAHFGDEHPVIRECDRMIRLQGFKQKLSIPAGSG